MTERIAVKHTDILQSKILHVKYKMQLILSYTTTKIDSYNSR